MKLKKGDLIIIVILAVAVLSWIGISKLGESVDKRQVVIEQNGKVYKTIALKAGMKQQEIHMELEEGRYIDIVVDQNGAYVEDVICPDKVCQKTGVVSKVGQSIVCLPNKVIVFIDGEAESEVDDISY